MASPICKEAQVEPPSCSKQLFVLAQQALFFLSCSLPYLCSLISFPVCSLGQGQRGLGVLGKDKALFIEENPSLWQAEEEHQWQDDFPHKITFSLALSSNKNSLKEPTPAFWTTHWCITEVAGEDAHPGCLFCELSGLAPLSRGEHLHLSSPGVGPQRSSTARGSCLCQALSPSSLCCTACDLVGSTN